MGYIPSYQRKVGNALEFIDLGVISDSFTLPKDGSNKLKDMHDNQSRFFLNVGKRDLLDKDSLVKLLIKCTPLKIYDIADVKIRDTYSFVYVIKGKEGGIFKLKGTVLGKREVTVQEAKEEEKPAYKDKGAPSGVKQKDRTFDKKGKKSRLVDKKDGSKARSDKAVKAKNNGAKKDKKSQPKSRKGKLSAMFEDELNNSYKINNNRRK